MNRQRSLAVVLLVLAFVALVASRAFPFLDDVSDAVKIAVVVAGAACGLAGVWLWWRKGPESES